MNEEFNNYFEMVQADSDELRNEVFKLRYQVYCVETGFENPEDFPDALEFDVFDSSSEHYLIRHIASGQYAATTRLILPDRGASKTIFPIEEHCRIDSGHVISKQQRKISSEVSRFCVSKSFKRRKGEYGTLAGISSDTAFFDFTEDERRTFPFITVALISSLVKLSVRHDIQWWYAVMEPALIRFLTHLGIYFTIIGPTVDYHGLRKPCKINLEEMLKNVQEKDINTWNMLTNRGSMWVN